MPSLRVLGHAFRAWRRTRRWAKHEPETTYLADLLSGAPVCLHVGASDGRHSYVMTQVAPKATIYAFEPSGKHRSCAGRRRPIEALPHALARCSSSAAVFSRPPRPEGRPPPHTRASTRPQAL